MRRGQSPAHLFYLSEVLGARGYVEPSASAAISVRADLKKVCVLLERPATVAEREVIEKMLAAVSVLASDVYWHVGEATDEPFALAKFGLRFGAPSIAAHSGIKIFEMPSLSDILTPTTSNLAKKAAWQQLKILRQEMGS